MVWEQLELTPAHISYITISAFLITYTLFATFIRNRLHLSEPPLALLAGILLGPRVLGWLTPNLCGVHGCSSPTSGHEQAPLGGWELGDDVIQEATRVIVGIQVFAVGIELPRYYASRRWRSIAMMLGPVMTLGWLICAGLVALIFQFDYASSMLIAACLTPTDPVLAASILSNSQFSDRVPARLRNLLSAETGCNDGISFPFLYIALNLLQKSTIGDAVQEWFTITILYQCVLGTLIGLVIGTTMNRALRFSVKHCYVDNAGFTVFYLLLALLSIGIGSILGSDDFLVAFGAGYGFARDGWFGARIRAAHLPKITDLLLNSAMFVYLGTVIPWAEFTSSDLLPTMTPLRIAGFCVLVLLFRRIPVVLALHYWIPAIRTVREALFCGHFGPMGLGGLFLAIEARAVLENGEAIPDPSPPAIGRPFTDSERALNAIWPIVAAVVMTSTFVHGLSVLVLSLVGHLSRPKHSRAVLVGGETEPLFGMVHEGAEEEDEEEDVEAERDAEGMEGEGRGVDSEGFAQEEN